LLARNFRNRTHDIAPTHFGRLAVSGTLAPGPIQTPEPCPRFGESSKIDKSPNDLERDSSVLSWGIAFLYCRPEFGNVGV
jgi:hypothetical protein